MNVFFYGVRELRDETYSPQSMRKLWVNLSDEEKELVRENFIEKMMKGEFDNIVRVSVKDELKPKEKLK